MTSSNQLFEAIYEKYHPLLCYQARSYGVEPADIDDLVHDTFLAYYSHYPLTWEGCQIRAMLGKILKNQTLDYFRQRNRRPQVLYDPQEIGALEGEFDQFVSQDSLSLLVENEKYQRVWDGLKTMKREWADVFELHIIQGKSIQEVSEMLGTTDAACRMRLTRGRKYLKKHLT